MQENKKWVQFSEHSVLRHPGRKLIGPGSRGSHGAALFSNFHNRWAMHLGSRHEIVAQIWLIQPWKRQLKAHQYITRSTTAKLCYLLPRNGNASMHF